MFNTEYCRDFQFISGLVCLKYILRFFTDRSKIANHILKLHPGKAVHVVDLRQCMGNLKFRNYEKKGCASKPKSKEWKKNVRLKLNFSPKKRQSPTAVSRKRKKTDHDSPGNVFKCFIPEEGDGIT